MSPRRVQGLRSSRIRWNASSLSIPSNIAEGSERDSTKDFISFLRYSKGSCGELRTQLYVAERSPRSA